MFLSVLNTSLAALRAAQVASALHGCSRQMTHKPTRNAHAHQTAKTVSMNRALADVPQNDTKRANGLPAKTLETKAGYRHRAALLWTPLLQLQTAHFDPAPKILPFGPLVLCRRSALAQQGSFQYPINHAAFVLIFELDESIERVNHFL